MPQGTTPWLGSCSAQERVVGGMDAEVIGPVMVTGVCGFIGSHVALALLRRGVTVIGVDKRPFNSTAHPVVQLRDLHHQHGLRLLTANVDAPEVVRRLAGVSAVVHLAAATDVGASWGPGFVDHMASVLGTQRLLDACVREGVPRMVAASSSHVYGPTRAGIGREDLPAEPTSPYGVAKLAAERLAVAYARRPGSPLATVALRFFTAFGPGCRPAMVVPRLFRAVLSGDTMPLYGDSAAPHTWTYVSDLVDATLRAVTLPLDPGQAEVINAAGPEQASLRQVADLVGDLVGRPVPWEAAGKRAGDATGTRADLTRAKQVLGFTPQVSLKDGLVRYWQHMRSSPHSNRSGPVPGAAVRA